jgi:hypothetical protein
MTRSLDGGAARGWVRSSSPELAKLAVLRAMTSVAYLAAAYTTVRPHKRAAAASGSPTHGGSKKDDCRRHFECNDPLLRCFQIAETARVLKLKNREFRNGPAAESLMRTTATKMWT